MEVIERCRICKNQNLVDVLDLGESCLSGRFPENVEEKIPKCPLVLTKCVNVGSTSGNVCGLVQLKHNINRDEMYKNFYGYASGINSTMKEHLSSLVNEIQSKVPLKESDNILDIGSNDCTTLKFYPTFCKRTGVDPTGKQYEKQYPSDVTLYPDYFDEKFVELCEGENKTFKVITTISMFYDIPEPVDMAKNIAKLLSLDGVWVMEQSYLPKMLETNSFDTVCHEHLEYYSLKQISYIAKEAGLYITDVSFNDTNGGSFRVYLRPVDIGYVFSDIIEKEKSLDTLVPFEDFRNRCECLKKSLLKFLDSNKHKKICVYGASTKGNVLLQYFGIDSTMIDCIAERNPLKYGRFTPSTNIPILSEDEVRKRKPDYMLVLPWHFKKEFLEREKEYLNKGGKLIFPLPNLEVYDMFGKVSFYIPDIHKKRRCLITGITGQIGSYMNEALSNQGCIVYGTSKRFVGGNVIKCDSCEQNEIKNVIRLVEPDEIYNFAGETNKWTTEIFPVESFQSLGNSVLYICDELKNIYEKTGKKIKLFQAQSSEMFTIPDENGEIVVKPERTDFSPKTPYSIAKVASYWIIRYYREKYGLSLYNGFISQTESKRRKDGFFTTKVASTLLKGEVLNVMNFTSKRNWIHAEDVVEGILTCMKGAPSEYVFSNNKNIRTTGDVIQICFDILGIQVSFVGNTVIENRTGKVLVISQDTKSDTVYGIDEKFEMNQKRTLFDIMNEIIQDRV